MISYRKATFEDIGELVRLRSDFAKEVQKITDNSRDRVFIETLTDYFKNTMPDDSFIAWVATDENRIVGTSGLCFYKLPPSYRNLTGNMAYIMNMYTLPNYRNKGIAKVLFEKIIMEAKQKGYKKISLHATEMGRPIYSKFGFKGIDTEMELEIN